MIVENIDPETMEVFEPIGSFNDEELKKKQPKDAPQLIYVIKANEKLNAECHSNCFTQINSGRVRFLIKEQDAKTKLIATKVGQKMSLPDRVNKLMPYELTTRLLEEVCNLRPKQGQDGLKLEKINSRIPKDKFSAFEYGLWLIRGIEEKYYKKKKRQKTSIDQYMMFTSRSKKRR